MSVVRTRVAPSPTGDPHVATGYIALMNYLFAKRHGGDFILRIEDTDRTRSTKESEQMILDSLRWLGLEWKEGPDVGGDFGPYRQSERSDTYRIHCESLLKSGHAFKCFCTTERLEAAREAALKSGKPTGYDGSCLNLTEEEVSSKEKSGIPFVVRMKVPGAGDCVFTDMKRGEVSIPWENVDMQVLLKSDGMPTYHLANVVDDHLMGITHVIRGEEWLSSTPKHILLYRHFGWHPPAFCHLPLLRNPDKNKTKLSKRRGATSMEWFKRAGYLPEALVNMLGLYALNVGDGQDDLLSLDEIEKEFSLDSVSLGGPVFDLEKLASLNGRWIRKVPDGKNETESDMDFADSFIEWMGTDRFVKAMSLARTRIVTFGDVLPLISFLWATGVPVSASSLAGKSSPEVVRDFLEKLLEATEPARVWNADVFSSAVKVVAEEKGMKLREAVRPLYVALTGSAQSLPLFESAEIMGKDVVRQRLRKAIAVLAAHPS